MAALAAPAVQAGEFSDELFSIEILQSFDSFPFAVEFLDEDSIPDVVDELSLLFKPVLVILANRLCFKFEFLSCLPLIESSSVNELMKIFSLKFDLFVSIPSVLIDFSRRMVIDLGVVKLAVEARLGCIVLSG